MISQKKKGREIMLFKQEDWDKGEKCPECESSVLVRETIYHDRVLSEEGKMTEIDIEQNNEVRRRIWCDECGTLLLEVPTEKGGEKT